MKTRLIAGDTQNRITQEFQSLMYMIELSFGSGDGKSSSAPAKVVQTEADALQFMKGFG